ncbi:hypothetical protein DFH07DRAFT_774619 [Mycena maculata]|uniref:Uncharacterized protein n=1 Tax=Mycena maculata TaxID=230809 RepID=A0AAD7N9X2_9AGAR|nr:hypothetical protein DFH07DRAFT_774619 [Mycena maculata]
MSSPNGVIAQAYGQCLGLDARRYFALLNNVGMLYLRFGTVPLENCHAWNLGKKVLIIVQSGLVGIVVILVMRVYAMYNCSKIVLFALLCVGMITGVLGAWSTGETLIPEISASGCEYAVSKERFLGDVAVFGFTVIRSYREPFKISGSILSILARDGALYFAVLALVNLANILMYYSWIAGSLSAFTSTMSVTMVARLMLNLHKATDLGILTDAKVFTTVDIRPCRNTRRDLEANTRGEA